MQLAKLDSEAIETISNCPILGALLFLELIKTLVDLANTDDRLLLYIALQLE